MPHAKIGGRYDVKERKNQQVNKLTIQPLINQTVVVAITFLGPIN